ncbi:intracellular protein transport-like protein [Ophiostoma piceae UAMH 11346]|uniref:Intracellular protein transport-like protein n=1 Tax=Ophiostoma piceae (strain UAMH 11346) TaxID=1262450 RepID=S3D1R2_OPHP1|nr:intracellular protein transport-like protein [Ophiostoma piceae UAMH 11346]
MSLDISHESSPSGRRTDHLLFSRQDDHHSSSSHSSSFLPSEFTSTSHSSSHPPSHTPFTTTSASASSLLSSTSDSSSVYPASSLYPSYTSTPSSGLSPSSSSNSVSAAASSVDTSLFSSPLPQERQEDSYYQEQEQHEKEDQDTRRSFDRPLPLALKTIDREDDRDDQEDEATSSSPTSSSHSHETLRIAPRSPSLSTLPSSTFSSSPTFSPKHSLHIAAGGYERRSQSLASIPTPTAAAHSIPYSYNRASVAPLAPIRRKPLSSSARTSIAAASAASASARNSVRTSTNVVLEETPLGVRESRELKEPLHLPALPPLPPLPQLRANLSPQISPQPEDSSFDLDSELEAEFSSLQFVTGVDSENDDDLHLQNPDQRFTRSGDLDSPTLYEFPKTAIPFGPNAPGALLVHVPSSLSRATSVRSESEVESEAEVESDNEPELQHSRSQSPFSTLSAPYSIREAIVVPIPETDNTDYSEAESEESDYSEDYEELEVYSLDLAQAAPVAPVAPLVTETAPSRNTEDSTPAASQTAPTPNETTERAVTSVATNPDTEQFVDEYPVFFSDNDQEQEPDLQSDNESDYPFDFTVEHVDSVADNKDAEDKDDGSQYSEHVADHEDSEQEQEQEHSHFDPADYFDQSESDYAEDLVDEDLIEASAENELPTETPVHADSHSLEPAVHVQIQPGTETEEPEPATKDQEPETLERAAPTPAPASAHVPTSVAAGTETKSETETSPLSTISRSRSSTMSLFTRKTSPPHLSLGSISNNSNLNTTNATGSNTKDDNAQRAVSPNTPNDRNSLYSVYDDDELKDKNIPTVLSAVPVINTDVDSHSPSQQNPPASAITIDTSQTGDSPTSTLKPVAKSPSSFKLGNFFGWPSASPASTEFSDQGYSPLPSPSSPSSLQPPNTVFTNASSLSTPASTSSPQFHQQDSFPNHSNNQKTRNLLGIISPTKSNVSGDDSSFYYDDYLQTPPIITTSQVTPTALSSSHSAPPLSPAGLIEDMEDELKAISAELAGSIRREMDLEDLVDRLQAEVSNSSLLQSSSANKRTSDYFSDSGTSSNKFGDYDAAKEEIAQVQRRAEQEKAQLRLELTDKLTDERSRRRVLDQQIKELSERAAEIDVDALQRDNSDASGRVKQLESTCEDLRRRLSEERGVKENFEDLLSAMKTELQNAANERDNLRDEIVPQLRARVEGLESQSSEHARQIYETTKMQQELQSLKEENLDLRSAAAAASAAAATTAASIIADSEQSAAGMRLQATGGLSRSNTVNRGQMGGPPTSTANTAESREALAERLKDVEAQRDALHNALKSLLERQEFQNRENDKKIRVLEIERQRLLTASPKKAGYERDVATLREEVSVLRRRAEEALEQKWQVEKGLGGLKMDLDRAEAEVTNLRTMLMQRDSEGGLDGLTASAALETAYNDLAGSYSDLLGKVTPNSSDEKTTLALQRLERALAATVSERDAARKEVAAAQARISEATTSEKALLDSERSLSEQLELSARRVEELAQQVREQIRANSTLRERLAQMVTRGEAEQHTHKERITGLESRLRALEDQLVTSQTAAEERVARHEDQVAAIKDAHNTQLQRLRDASGSLRSVSPGGGRMSPLNSPRLMSQAQFGGFKSPMSPMFSVNGKLVPPFNAGPGSSRPSSRGSMVSFNGNSGSGANTGAAAAAAAYAHSAAADQEQQAQVTTLRARVSDLEAALSLADREMQEVVGRMNTAQIEVMQLQEELEVANRDTRRLQRTLEEEKVKGFEERFKMIGRSATAA